MFMGWAICQGWSRIRVNSNNQVQVTYTSHSTKICTSPKPPFQSCDPSKRKKRKLLTTSTSATTQSSCYNKAKR